MAISYDNAAELANTVMTFLFNDDVNSTYPDVQGSINTVDNGGLTFTTDGVVVGEKALEFDGSGTNFEIPKSDDYDMKQGAFTVEFSIIPRNSANLYQTIIGQKQTSYNPGTVYIQYRASGSRLTFGSADYGARPTVSGLTLNERHDVLVSRDSTGRFVVKVDDVVHTETNTQLVNFNGGDLAEAVQFGYSPWDGNNGKLGAVIDGFRMLKGYSVIESFDTNEISQYVNWYDRTTVSKVEGFVTLDENPIIMKVVIVTNHYTTPSIVAVTKSDIDGFYSVAIPNQTPVMVFTMQDYGDAWTDLTAITIGDTVHPTTPNGYFYEALTAGNTGAVEPVWTTDESVTIIDGGITWQPRILLKPEMQGYVTPTPIT